MSLSERVKQLEKNILMNPDLFKEKINFEEMTDEALDSYLLNEIRDEIKEIKNIAHYHNIDITNKEGFEAGLSIYAEKYCTEEMRKEYYNPEMIKISGELFQDYKNRGLL